jgi:hypothetical protein
LGQVLKLRNLSINPLTEHIWKQVENTVNGRIQT